MDRPATQENAVNWGKGSDRHSPGRRDRGEKTVRNWNARRHIVAREDMAEHRLRQSRVVGCLYLYGSVAQEASA